jgi:hypothetical protein
MPRGQLIQVRSGTAAAWVSANPILAAGEPGLESDTGKEKRGDGATAWTSLAYITDVSRLPSSVVTATGVAGHPTSGTWATNQSIVDANGLVWTCTAGGTPGTWEEGSAGGGSVTITSPDSTLTIGGTSSAPTIVAGPSLARGTLIAPVVGPVAKTVSQPVGSSSPWTQTVTLPSMTIGNEAILFVSSGAAPVTPTGWTSAVTPITANTATQYQYERVIDGTEGATLVVTWTTSPNQSTSYVQVTQGQANSGEVWGSPAHATAQSISASVVTPAANCLVYYFQASSGNTSVTASPPTGWTETTDNNSSFGFRQASIGYKIVSAASTTVSLTLPLVTSGATNADCSLILVAIPSNNFQQPLYTSTDIDNALGYPPANLNQIINPSTGKLVDGVQQPGSYGVWQQLGDPGVNGQVTDIAICPSDPNRAIVVGDMLGAAITENASSGDVVWEPCYGFPAWEMCTVTWHPTDPDVVWIACLAGAFMSTDGGHWFTPMNTGLPTTGA